MSITPSRRPEDSLRSLKRYTAVALEALDLGWEVRLGREEGAFRRPFARVMPAGTPTVMVDNQFLGTITQPYAVYAYPARLGKPDDAEIQAQSVESALQDAFMVGVAEGKPLRVPLYNYLGIPMNQPGEWLPPDYIRISNISTQTVTDPDDNLLWTVQVSLRAQWRRTLLPSATGELLASISVEPA